jgi:hypothetical protein
MSRPTPETDARTYVPTLGASTVPAEFARQLERERDEAREALRQIWQFDDAFLPYIEKETINRWRKAAGWGGNKMKSIIKKFIISRLEDYYIQPWWMKRAYYDCQRREIVMVAFPLNYIVSLAWWLNLKWGEFRQKPTWLDAIIKQRDEARESLKHITEYGTEEINAAVELRQKLAQALVELDNMQDQRDEARENLNEEKKWHHRTHKELIEAQSKLLDIEYDKLKS